MAACTGLPGTQDTTPPAGATETQEPIQAGTQEFAAGSALAAVEELTVKGRAPKTGYDRDNFGKGWLDPAGVGCDQRNIILARDLTDVTFRDGGDCIVESGTLHEPFSGETILFERGPETSFEVHIDHLVALSDAWQKGAQEWSAEKRILFANDPLNLLAVKGTLNMQKGDADVATWLPPDKSFRCEYVAQIVGVKHHYDLWVTEAEQTAMRDVLSQCPTLELPSGGYPLDGSLPVSDSAAGNDKTYRNCTEVWDTLGRPIEEGDHGYTKRLDRDGDGVGCEIDPRK